MSAVATTRSRSQLWPQHGLSYGLSLGLRTVSAVMTLHRHNLGEGCVMSSGIVLVAMRSLNIHLCSSDFISITICLAKRKKEKSRPPPSAPRDLIWLVQFLDKIYFSFGHAFISFLLPQHPFPTFGYCRTTRHGTTTLFSFVIFDVSSRMTIPPNPSPTIQPQKMG